MALLTVIGNLALYYYSSLLSCDVASSLRLGIGTQILDILHVEVRIAGEGARCSDLYCVRGRRALEPQKAM